jgi:hypothetical protein
MRKKSLTCIEDEPSHLSRASSKNSIAILTQPHKHKDNLHINESHVVATHKSKEFFKIRDYKSRTSLNAKKNEEMRMIEERKERNIDHIDLDTLDKCRKVFDKVIEKDKKYGKILKKIKDMYEKQLDSYCKPTIEHDTTVKDKVPQKNEGIDKMKILKKTCSKSKSYSFISHSKQVKAPAGRLHKKDSISTLNTVHTSPRNLIPELSLNSIPKTDFHQEFIANYDNFSESWRQLIGNIRK